jgi:hypothetical protein|mmetsp:Transcript_24496/g.44311  ORF Transcript_24496/g.44311 Transcript_24496/m.44311 type:complete len:89 (-) Transcript_24496:586-852(-)
MENAEEFSNQMEKDLITVRHNESTLTIADISQMTKKLQAHLHGTWKLLLLSSQNSLVAIRIGESGNEYRKRNEPLGQEIGDFGYSKGP